MDREKELWAYESILKHRKERATMRTVPLHLFQEEFAHELSRSHEAFKNSIAKLTALAPSSLERSDRFVGTKKTAELVMKFDGIPSETELASCIRVFIHDIIFLAALHVPEVWKPETKDRRIENTFSSLEKDLRDKFVPFAGILHRDISAFAATQLLREHCTAHNNLTILMGNLETARIVLEPGWADSPTRKVA